MSDNQNSHEQQNHDQCQDCQDCKKQRQQNDLLVSIYQKLQQVDKKTTQTKIILTKHKKSNSQSQNKLQQLAVKLKNGREQKNNQEQAVFQQIGYQLYADLIGKRTKDHAERENQRLKQVLKNIYKQKANQKTSQNKSILFSSQQNKSQKQWFQPTKRHQNQSEFNESSRKSSFRQTTCKQFQIFSTKSSFNLTKRRIFQKKDFQQLNLWLFQNKNQNLQKQLYQQTSIQPLKSLSKPIKPHHIQNVKQPYKLTRYNKMELSLQSYGDRIDRSKARFQKEITSNVRGIRRKDSLLPDIRKR